MVTLEYGERMEKRSWKELRGMPYELVIKPTFSSQLKVIPYWASVL